MEASILPTDLESTDPSSVEALMARLARRDGSALSGLLEHHGHRLGRVIGSIARQRGARLTREESQELILEAALEMADVAPSWDPAGAPPWIWARARLATVVDRHVGQWATSLDDDRHTVGELEDRAAADGHEPAVLEVLKALGGVHPSVALLREATERVASPRDQAVFFETAVQVTLGDRSPSVTVGRLLGMRPDAVRQQHRRVRVRLLQLAAVEARFAALADLPLLQPSAA